MLKCLACSVLILFAAPSLAEVSVENAKVRAMPPSAPNTAGYMQLTSKDQDDALVGASCDNVMRTELHTILEENGLMKMREVEQILLPADQPVALQQGGYHLMMMGLKKPLKEGDTMTCQLDFRLAGTQSLELKVSYLNGADAAHHHHH